MAKDYYTILGIDPSATQEEIRSAYRQKAKELHPDHYDGSSEPFRTIHEAYAVLSDPARRRAYDDELAGERRSRNGQSIKPHRVSKEPIRTDQVPAEPLIPTEGPTYKGWESSTHPFRTTRSLFDEIFGPPEANFWNETRQAEQVDLTVEISLTPGQARRGGSARVLIPLRSPCPVCRGRGSAGLYRCRYCWGSGIVEEKYPISIVFPAGILNGETATVPLDQLNLPSRYLTVRFRVTA